MKIFIVIPAFNEEQHIKETIAAVQSAGAFEIVVVDDGSTDRTFEYARLLAIALHHPVNRGMGAALATGTQYAINHGADIIVHFDADGQHDAQDIARIVHPILEDRVDVALGSRYLQKNTLPWSKRYLIHLPALVVQNMSTGLRLTDVHNGFRALNRHAAQTIQITQDRMAHASEIISEIAHHKLRYCEVPITVRYYEYGQGFRDGIRIYTDLLLKKIIK